jgi:hypothetical protein
MGPIFAGICTIAWKAGGDVVDLWKAGGDVVDLLTSSK